MITHESQWRMKLARQVAAGYLAHANVQAIFVGGSTARGCADAYSDIELGMIWNENPSKEQRQKAIESILGIDPQFIRVSDYDRTEDYWWDDFYLGSDEAQVKASGVSVEISHHRLESVEAIIDAVVNQYDPDELKQNYLAGIQSGVTLHGETILKRLKSRIETYPRELALAVIRRNIQIEQLRVWRSNLERGPNLLRLHDDFVAISKQIVRLVFALNGIYNGGDKWVFQDMTHVPIKPAGFPACLNEVFTSDPETAILQILEPLVFEIYDLIEQHFPEIEVDSYRLFFRYRRTPWIESPIPIRQVINSEQGDAHNSGGCASLVVRTRRSTSEKK